MVRPVPAKILVLICVLTFLASGYGSANAAFWCFGADGHVGYKASSVSGCASAPGGTDRGVRLCASVRQGTECCGPCLDIPAFPATQGFGGKREQSPAQALATSGPAFSSFALAAGQTAIGRLPQPPPASNSALLHLKTVVLLN